LECDRSCRIQRVLDHAVTTHACMQRNFGPHAFVVRPPTQPPQPPSDHPTWAASGCCPWDVVPIHPSAGPSAVDDLQSHRLTLTPESDISTWRRLARCLALLCVTSCAHQLTPRSLNPRPPGSQPLPQPKPCWPDQSHLLARHYGSCPVVSSVHSDHACACDRAHQASIETARLESYGESDYQNVSRPTICAEWPLASWLCLPGNCFLSAECTTDRCTSLIR